MKFSLDVGNSGTSGWGQLFSCGRALMWGIKGKECGELGGLSGGETGAVGGRGEELRL